MAGSRPAPSRAVNVPPLSHEKKAALLREMGVPYSSPGSMAVKKQPSDHCEITPALQMVTRLPMAAPRKVPVSNNKIRAPLSPAGPAPASDWWGSTTAVLRGAGDSLPLGVVDRAFAAGHAIADAAAGKSFGAAYDRRLEAERAQDRYDEAHHSTARLVGEIGGNLVQTAIPMMGAARIARIAEATPLLRLREAGKLMGIGGGSNAALEAVVDGIHGEFSPAKILGAGAGGVLGTAAAFKGKPGAAAAITGGATSLIQDTLSGNLNSGSLLRASEASAAGSMIAGGAGRLRAMQVNRLPIRAKGNLGERLSEARTWLRGDSVVGRHQPVPVRGGNTRPDHITAGGETVEAKFGPYARLSRRQVEGYESIPRYRVDHFLPRDIGALIETPLGIVTYQGQNLADRWKR